MGGFLVDIVVHAQTKLHPTQMVCSDLNKNTDGLQNKSKTIYKWSIEIIKRTVAMAKILRQCFNF